MPLPTTDQAWPPAPLAPIRAKLEEWNAWYAGDPAGLASVYRTHVQRTRVRPGQLAGGVVGAVSRMWWGRPNLDLTQARRDQLHVPVAADLARVSADLLYSEPPQLSVGDDAGASATQDRISGYVDDGFHDVLATGAEVGAALGGRFHRVTWDAAMLDRPFLTTVDADAAWPQFRWGRLVAVTFWHVVATNGQVVRRHLERHELAPDGTGLVFHGLYEGTTRALGRAIPLTEDPATKDLATRVDATGALIEGRTPGLAVAYIPNQTPNRTWRAHAIGRHLGRSDFDSVEPLMDAVDETYSSLMRDIRLAKSRIVVPSYMLTTAGAGQGAAFDLDREVYAPLNHPLPEDGKFDITPHQFDIRVDEHLRTIDDLIRRIISTAGYSAQTLSDGVEAGQMTATEVHARERRSYLTRDRKIRHERPALMHLVRKMLSVDTAVFGTPGLEPGDLKVTFADTVQDSLLSLASTAQQLAAARAASIETRVKLVHPDWTDPQVADERDRILGEERVVTDPFAIGA